MNPTPEAARQAVANAPWEELAAILGGEHLRAATAADAVDGVSPQKVAEPGNAEELAKVLRVADGAGLSVIPRGNGSKIDWGCPPRRADLVLSTARINRLREHAWSDMTATVESGCTVAILQKNLAEHGQWLAIDPLWPGRATIGGILSTNESGSLRVRYGALRDLIIGITLALADGTLARSGGKVVKNVAGYDLPKLATGAFGTLGIITEATFRLYPLPREARSFRFSSDSTGPLCKVALSILASQLVHTGVQLRAGRGAAPLLDVRLEGTPAGLDAQERQLLSLAKATTNAGIPADAWAARDELWRGTENAIIAKCSVLPTDLQTYFDLLRDTCGPLDVAWRTVAQANGLSLVRLEAGAEGSLLSATASLRNKLEQLGGSLVVLSCAVGMKSKLDVWGAAGDALPLMKRIKEQLDPNGTLNPGRFVGGI